MGRGVLLLLVASALAGCASVPAAINPVSWWHDLEGGPIAGQRLPPPGAAAPYPNLANVPASPAFLPAQERDRISASLLAERQGATQQAVLEPLPSATATDAGPPLLAPAPAPSGGTPSPGTASASLSAVTRSAPAPGPEPPPAALPANVATAVAALPDVPLTPPPPPSIAGIGEPGPPPAPFTGASTEALRIGFAPGSAVLAATDRTKLEALVARRGGRDIAVIGLGGADTSDAPAQSSALRLGLARAQAVAAALARLNVPDAALRLGAEASGSGAVVRLIQ